MIVGLIQNTLCSDFLVIVTVTRKPAHHKHAASHVHGVQPNNKHIVKSHKTMLPHTSST